MLKCSVNYNNDGEVISVGVENKNKTTKEELNEIISELYSRSSAEEKAGESSKRIIDRVKSERNKGTVTNEVWESVAKSNDFWIEDYESGKEIATLGLDNIVYLNTSDNSTIYKVNHSVDNFEDFYKSILDYNQMFPSTAYEIVGLTRLNKDHYGGLSKAKGIGAKGNLSVVLKQNFIPNKQRITESEVENYMNYIGFKRKDGTNDYTNDDVKITLKTNDVIKDSEGNYHIVSANVNINSNNNLKTELERVNNINSEQASTLSDVVNKIYNNIAKRLGLSLEAYKRRIAVKTVNSVSKTVDNFKESLQNMRGLSNELLNDLSESDYTTDFQGVYGEVDNKYIKNSGFKEGDYILNSLMSLDDYFKFLGYESIKGFGKKKILSEIETRLIDILNRAENTNDFYIKSISKKFLEKGLERAQDVNEYEAYKRILDGDTESYDNQLKSFQDIQRNSLLNSINYLIKSEDYSPEFKYLMVGLVLKGNTVKDVNIEIEDADGNVTGVRKIDGKELTRSNTTVGIHQTLSPMSLPYIYKELINGSKEHPMDLLDNSIDEGYITFEETQELIEDRIIKKQDDGVWVIFDQSDNDYDIDALTKVSKKVAKVMGDDAWCTANGMAESYLPAGDFYLFLDNNLEPKVTIRYEGSYITELKGVGKGQALEESQIENVDNFLNEIHGGLEYKNNLELFKIKKKIDNNESFSEEDLLNVVNTYELYLETYNNELSNSFDKSRDKLLNNNIEFLKKHRDIIPYKFLLKSGHMNLISIDKIDRVAEFIDIHSVKMSDEVKDYVRKSIESKLISEDNLKNLINSDISIFNDNVELIENNYNDYYNILDKYKKTNRIEKDSRNNKVNPLAIKYAIEYGDINKYMVDLFNHNETLMDSILNYLESKDVKLKFDIVKINNSGVFSKLLYGKYNKILDINGVSDADIFEIINRGIRDLSISAEFTKSINKYKEFIQYIIDDVTEYSVLNYTNNNIELLGEDIITTLVNRYILDIETVKKYSSDEFYKKIEENDNLEIILNDDVTKLLRNKDLHNLNKAELEFLIKNISHRYIVDKNLDYRILNSAYQLGIDLNTYSDLIIEKQLNLHEATTSKEMFDSYNKKLKAYIVLKEGAHRLSALEEYLRVEEGYILKSLQQDNRGVILKSNFSSMILLDKLQADITTPMHELAHEYERVLNESELETLENWSGHKQGTTEFSEAFAKGFEKYIYEGSTLNEDVDGVFSKLAKWFRNVIDIFAEYFGDINELNDDVRLIYSKILISENSDLKTLPEITQVTESNEFFESELFKELSELPLLDSNQALDIYKQSFSTSFENWEELDLNC